MHPLQRVERLGLERLPPGESEKLAGEPRRPVRGLGNGLDVALALLLLEVRTEEHVGRAPDHRQHVVEVVGDAACELSYRLHLLRLPKRLVGPLQLGGALVHPLFQRLVGALNRLVKPRIVDADRCLRRKADHQPLMAFGELRPFGMSEEQPAYHFAGAADHRHREIASHREMALWHPVVRWAFPVPFVLGDVVRPDRALAAEGRVKYRRVPRHSEMELRRLGAGQGEQHVALALVAQHIVEEGAELSAGQLHSGIGYHLDHPLQVQLAGERSSSSVQRLERPALLLERLASLPNVGDVFHDLEEARAFTPSAGPGKIAADPHNAAIAANVPLLEPGSF